jgi:succinate dehydrogenase/fumarate reductase iron-sulfur protein
MTKKFEIEVLRYNPEVEQEPIWCTYTVPGEEKNTVLGALLYIQEYIDPSLAFRYGCRYKCCGLCAVEINGRPRIACHTYLREGMRITPLSKLPVIRDLVIDREMFFSHLRTQEIYFDSIVDDSIPVKESEIGSKLRACTECLTCLTTCHKYEYGNVNFFGPYLFVKLAQLYFDPRDKVNRKLQALKLGLEKCYNCNGGCHCLNGIDIYHQAVKSLLSE